MSLLDRYKKNIEGRDALIAIVEGYSTEKKIQFTYEAAQEDLQYVDRILRRTISIFQILSQPAQILERILDRVPVDLIAISFLPFKEHHSLLIEAMAPSHKKALTLFWQDPKTIPGSCDDKAVLLAQKDLILKVRALLMQRQLSLSRLGIQEDFWEG